MNKQMKIFLDKNRQKSLKVEISESTTFEDIINICRSHEATGAKATTSCHIAELCMGYERVMNDKDNVLQILEQWGNHKEKVRFILHTDQHAELKKIAASQMGIWQQMSDVELRQLLAAQQCHLNTRCQLLASHQLDLKELKEEKQVQEQELNIKKEALNEKVRQMDAKKKKVPTATLR